jgi:hypothetical protein
MSSNGSETHQDDEKNDQSLEANTKEAEELIQTITDSVDTAKIIITSSFSPHRAVEAKEELDDAKKALQKLDNIILSIKSPSNSLRANSERLRTYINTIERTVENAERTISARSLASSGAPPGDNETSKLIQVTTMKNASGTDSYTGVIINESPGALSEKPSVTAPRTGGRRKRTRRRTCRRIHKRTHRARR